MPARFSKGLRFLPLVGLSLLVCLCVGSVAFGARFIGLDGDGDLDCEPATADMGQVWGPGDIGTTQSLDVVVENDANLVSASCTFCVRDKNKVSFVSWTYDTPSGWTDGDIIHSDSVGIYFEVSQWIIDAYPNHRCWLVQSTDYTLANPISSFPYKLGTFQYQVTGTPDTKAGFVLDGDQCGWLTSGYGSGTFGGTGETCEGPAAVDQTQTWGSVKKLFR